MGTLGKLLIILGSVIVLAGLVLTLAGHIPLLSRLPGDILYQKGSVRIYLPITTSILLSIVLTVVLNLFIRR